MRSAIVFVSVIVVGAACRSAAPAPAPAPIAVPRTKPATHVVVLEPLVATPVTRGPFVVLTINPGNDLQLAISKTESCDDVTWFVYSGGGAAVGADETLCAASRAEEAVTHGFSGHD